MRHLSSESNLSEVTQLIIDGAVFICHTTESKISVFSGLAYCFNENLLMHQSLMPSLNIGKNNGPNYDQEMLKLHYALQMFNLNSTY